MRARLATVAAVLLLAGCHSGGTAPAKRPFAAYRQCLEQHGVEPRRGRAASTTTSEAGGSTTSTPSTTSTTSTPGTTSPDPGAFAAARQACRKLRPAGGLRSGGIASDARTAFRRCLADRGVTLPTEPTSAGPPPAAPRGGMLAGLNRNDPTVAAALSACRPLLAPASTTSSTRGK